MYMDCLIVIYTKHTSAGVNIEAGGYLTLLFSIQQFVILSFGFFVNGL